MTVAILSRATLVTAVVVLALGASHRAAEPGTHQGFLYGRVITDRETYEGRLRFGGDEEAFWGDYFNGFKAANPWASHVPGQRPPIKIFGFEIPFTGSQIDLGRPLMARFGDITRIEASGRDLKVILKSGTVFHLDRFGADDFADGVRVWDHTRGVVNLDDEWQIRSIELLPLTRPDTAPHRLHGTVRTAHGNFTGFIQWDRKASVGPDELPGHAADGQQLRPRFDTIRSIARRAPASSLVTLLDGREIVLSGTREAGKGHRGIYVDDLRYGRVLVSWDAFDRIDFNAGDRGPAYADFPPGRPLTGSVTTRAGRRLTGRLVYDLDESETTETLDAPSQGVDYTIPFGLVGSIVVGLEAGGAHRAKVTLQDGRELQLERAGDLGNGNAGMLIFVAGIERPEYVPWHDIAQINFDRPPAMYPPLAGR